MNKMARIMKKLLNWLKKLFGKINGKIVIPNWDECTKSSNWSGKNAAKRMMNILSPHMADATFKERVAWMKGRGCNCAHVFVTNKADGEKAGYSPYGNKFDFVFDKNYCKVMGDRIKYLNKQGLGVILWLMADDSNAWAKTAQSNFAHYCKDIKELGWFDYASTVVIGLEIEEYWNNAGVIANLVKATKQFYKGKVGTHHISGSYALAGTSDIAFVQLNPGQSDSAISSYVRKVKGALNKPVNMFELERNEDRHRSEVALKAGAFGVGNW